MKKNAEVDLKTTNFFIWPYTQGRIQATIDNSNVFLIRFNSNIEYLNWIISKDWFESNAQ